PSDFPSGFNECLALFCRQQLGELLAPGVYPAQPIKQKPPPLWGRPVPPCLSRPCGSVDGEDGVLAVRIRRAGDERGLVCRVIPVRPAARSRFLPRPIDEIQFLLTYCWETRHGLS